MAEQKQEPKKRQPKPGTQRVMVTLTEVEYKLLADEAEKQMREPNNLLSYALRGKVEDLLNPV